MGRTKKEVDGSVKKKTFRFDAVVQGRFDEIASLVNGEFRSKYYLRNPSEQEVLEHVLKHYLELRQRLGTVLAGNDEG